MNLRFVRRWGLFPCNREDMDSTRLDLQWRIQDRWCYGQEGGEIPRGRSLPKLSHLQFIYIVGCCTTEFALKIFSALLSLEISSSSFQGWSNNQSTGALTL